MPRYPLSKGVGNSSLKKKKCSHELGRKERFEREWDEKERAIPLVRGTVGIQGTIELSWAQGKRG